jgi:hypothetical protein
MNQQVVKPDLVGHKPRIISTGAGVKLQGAL